MDHLIAGYHRYRAQRWPDLKERHRALARGQNPKVCVLACCDSRVDPATIFDADPGELFVIRNIANLAPPYEEGGGRHGVSAAIEFAVGTLEVETVMVLGHAMCGGVAASVAREQRHIGPFLDRWVELLEPAKARVDLTAPDALHQLEHESVKLSIENLMSFPFIAWRVREGKLKLQGAYYGVADGRLMLLDAATGKFAPVE